MDVVPDEHKDIVGEAMKEVVDHIENVVNSAKRLLEDIHGVENLNQVEECKDILDQLASDLY
jgi:DNA-binding FrmR family transcriptional regulator